MTSKGFTFIEHVILALLIAILVRMALPTLSASLSKLRGSREHAYVASMKTDLVQLVTAEEDYFRDSSQIHERRPMHDTSHSRCADLLPLTRQRAPGTHPHQR